MTRDWPTLVVLFMCYGLWGLSTVWLAAVSPGLAVCVTAVLIALQSSLQHEVIHGHPFRNRVLNAALVFPSLNLAIPYLRFRDTHLAHHRDANLTDPYDDPESNYIDPLVWVRMPVAVRAVLWLNNTLLGRLALGPLIGQIGFMRQDAALILEGDRAALRGWLWHLPAMGVVLGWLIWVGTMPIWAYCLAVYLGLSLLKLRTYLEHQAHDSARGRTVVIDDQGPFAFLFLNNNYHVVHHMHPRVPWFQLPGLFRANRDKYLRRNHGYYYRSYFEVIRRHLLRPKDPVAHPLWRGDQRQRPLPPRKMRAIR